MDIISKTIEPQRRARFFSLGNFIGGVFTILIGFFVTYVLSDESGLAFPDNYALLFGSVVLTIVISFVVFLKIREPIRPVQTRRKTFWRHVKQGPHFLRTDRNYRWFILYRIFVNVSRMCVPFYTPYALDKLKVPDETIGAFLQVVAVSGVISNVLWGYIGERYGIRWILICTSLLACTAPMIAISVRYLPTVWQVPWYFLTFAFGGASMSGMMIGFVTYMINIAPPLNRPTYLGFLNTIVFPFGFMPLVAGQLVGWIDYEGTFAIAIGVGFFAFLTATRLQDVYHEEEFTQQA
jgi:MFS family permease